MGFKFHGKDFQAWANFELNVEGLTVLIGPSNEGKSSIHRALMGLVRNELGQHFVRTQGDKLDLTLEIDGATVNATRTKKGSVVYTVNRPEFDKPKVFEKLNGAIPDEVLALGMNSLSIADTVLDPIFASQKDPRQFMLQETPMVLNAILGRFSSTERLEGGKREANTRVAEKNSEAKTIAKQIQAAEALKSTLSSLAIRAESISTSVATLTPEIQQQEECIAELGLLIERQARAEHLADLLHRLPAISTLEIEKMVKALIVTEDLHSSTARLGELRRITKRLVIPNVDLAVQQAAIIVQAGELAHSQKALDLNRKWFEQAESVIAIWTGIVAAYNLHKALTATLTILADDAAGKAREKATALDELHRDLSAAHDNAYALLVLLDTISVVEKRVLRLSDLNGQVESCREQLTDAHLRQGEIENELESDRIRLEQERAQLEADALLCPHCGLNIHESTGDEHVHSSPSISAPVAARA